MREKVCIGIDLGGTKTHFALINKQGEILRDFRRITDNSGGKELLADLLRGTEELINYAQENEKEVLGLGVGSPGRIDALNGLVVDCTPNISEWQGTNLKDFFQEKLNLPTFADNDANVAAYGEYFIRKAAGLQKETMIMLTIGTGLGSGVIYRDSLFRGKGFATEIGHMILKMGGRQCNCGQKGCLEMYVSGTALEIQAKERRTRYPDSLLNFLSEKDLTSFAIFSAAEKGDFFSLLLIDELAEALAESLISLVNIFDPDLILLGGGISRQNEFYLKKVRKLTKEKINYKYFDEQIIQIAKNDEKAGVVGAGLLAFLGIEKGAI